MVPANTEIAQLYAYGLRPKFLPARRPTQGREAGLYWRKPRHTNPLNPKALVRAERRMAMFTGWVKRHFKIASQFPARKKARRFGGRRRK